MTTQAIAPQHAAASSSPLLRYYGGKILENPKFVSLYAGDFWSTRQGALQQAKLDRCSAAVPSGDHSTVWEEYGVSPGKFKGSARIPLSKPRPVVTEGDIRTMVASAIKQSGVAAPDGDTVYTVFLPPKVALTDGYADSRDGMGGYHGSYRDEKSGKKVYYAAIAYTDKGNGVRFTSSSVDNISIAASHEWTEAVTDPDVNAGKLGWYNKRFGEVGDIPINLGYPLSQLWGRVDGCAVQKEWSNALGEPVLTE